MRNRRELTPREQARIYDRIARARALHSFVEALAQPIDAQEGAGLGILILLQFLKRLGLGEEAFAIEAAERGDGGLTPDPDEQGAAGEDQRAHPGHRPRRGLPAPLPRDRSSSSSGSRRTPGPPWRRIAARIATDPALTADLLKLVNSAYYVLPRRVNNILQGVKIVGMKGLRNLLYSYGAQQDPRREVRGDEAPVGSFLPHRVLRLSPGAELQARGDILDDVYVAGILHDLGQIIVT